MITYTGTGDDGNTSLLNGERASKDDARIHLAGELDELNAHLGLMKTKISGAENRLFIQGIQTALMKLMAHSSDAADERYFFSGEETQVLEQEIDRLSERLPQRFGLVLPGENETEAQIHIARTVARKAERRFAAVNAAHPLNRHAGIYLNRLADYLFVLAMNEC